MTDLKPLGAHLYSGAEQVLYLLGELSNREFRSMLICPERNARAVTNSEGK